MTEEENIIKQYIEDIVKKNEKDYKKFLKELINIKSVDRNELDVAERIIIFLKRHNFQQNDYYLDTFDADNRRANLIANLNPLKKTSEVNDKERILLYNGHMDVVGVGEKRWRTANNRFSGEYDEKYFYGRGTSDMKAGLAAMVIALTILKELKDAKKVSIPGNLILNAVAAEETKPAVGTIRSRNNLIKERELTQCDFAVVGEATSFARGTKSIAVGEKGTTKVTITTKGEMGHTSNTNQGKNALDMMLTLLGKINLKELAKRIPKGRPPISEQKFKQILKNLSHNDPSEHKKSALKKNYELISNLTYNISAIDVGRNTALNVTPDRCNVSIDFRTLPGHEGELIKDALEKLIKAMKNKKKNKIFTDKDFSVKRSVVPASEYSIRQNTRHTADFKEGFMNTVRSIYGQDGIDVFEFFFPASADAIHYRMGEDPFCPETILFGPGEYDLIHGVDEVCEIKDFLNAILVYTLFAYRFLTKQI